MLQEGTEKTSYVTHVKIQQEVSHISYAFCLEQIKVFQKIVCKASKSCGRKAWNGIAVLVLNFM